eukprot:2868616-Amphidinium_carterae.1
MASKVHIPDAEKYSDFLAVCRRMDILNFMRSTGRVPPLRSLDPPAEEATDHHAMQVSADLRELLRERLPGMAEYTAIPDTVIMDGPFDFKDYGSLWHLLSKNVTDVDDYAPHRISNEVRESLRRGRFITTLSGEPATFSDALARYDAIPAVMVVAGKAEYSKTTASHSFDTGNSEWHHYPGINE